MLHWLKIPDAARRRLQSVRLSDVIVLAKQFWFGLFYVQCAHPVERPG